MFLTQINYEGKEEENNDNDEETPYPQGSLMWKIGKDNDI